MPNTKNIKGGLNAGNKLSNKGLAKANIIGTKKSIPLIFSSLDIFPIFLYSSLKYALVPVSWLTSDLRVIIYIIIPALKSINIGSILITQSMYMYSTPVISSIYPIATRFIPPPIGEPNPPKPAPHAIANNIFAAALLSDISSFPTYASIDIAIGVKAAATTTFGKKMLITVEAINHTAICCFMEGPIIDIVLRAILLLSPVASHLTVIMLEPIKSITNSAAYWFKILFIGTKPNTAFVTIGKNAVTAILTGVRAHHNAIHKNVPNAPLTGNIKTLSGIKNTLIKNNIGPDNKLILLFILKLFSFSTFIIFSS